MVGLLPARRPTRCSLDADGLFYGAGLFGVLHAFASGGAAVTGVEAISNGVPAFREPAWKNARQTLVVMGSGSGSCSSGCRCWPPRSRSGPSTPGTPTVISQVGEAVYGDGPLGHVLFYSLQAGTMLILIMAANTGFADFPRLASFQAGDSFLPTPDDQAGPPPRVLQRRPRPGRRRHAPRGRHRRRGHAPDPALRHRRVHRLHALAGRDGEAPPHPAPARLAAGHRHQRDRLLPVGVVLLIVSITKFAEGAWVILIVLPVLVVLLLRLNRQYVREAIELEDDVPAAARPRSSAGTWCSCSSTASTWPPPGPSSTPARLTPDELRAVHFALDDDAAARPRRAVAPARAAAGAARRGRPAPTVGSPAPRSRPWRAELVRRRRPRCRVLLPERKYRGVWHRVLHDRTAERASRPSCPALAPRQRDVGARTTSTPSTSRSCRLPTFAATVNGNGAVRRSWDQSPTAGPPPGWRARRSRPRPGTTPIADVVYRRRTGHGPRPRHPRRPAARRAHPRAACWSTAPGSISLVFLGRRPLAAVEIGSVLVAEGTAGLHRGRLALLNPTYEMVPTSG